MDFCRSPYMGMIGTFPLHPGDGPYMGVKVSGISKAGWGLFYHFVMGKIFPPEALLYCHEKHLGARCAGPRLPQALFILGSEAINMTVCFLSRYPSQRVTLYKSPFSFTGRGGALLVRGEFAGETRRRTGLAYHFERGILRGETDVRSKNL
uniref:Uncharacterized protein n=1 Tax=Candidatus Kentrum sp. FW TaxID=2126338 RepID=A0A450SX58_9GAMM|nr:MAG: hypothetical protein BECKFW1821A_GA0114235_108413 [Candidatus Kentron sp. FW]